MNPDYPNSDEKQQKYDEDYLREIKSDFRRDLEVHDTYIAEFEPYEAMLMSRTYDNISKRSGGGLTDGSTTTIYLERAARVAGQLASGVMRAAGKKDQGASLLLDLLRQKWMHPNANSQAPLLQKYRWWQFGASVYGFMPMYYDWCVDRNGYTGPDCWIWSPRNFIPQNGRATINDMDYCHAIVYVGREWLKDRLDDPDSYGWDKENLRELIEMLGKNKKQTRDVNSQRDSFITRQRQSQAERGRITLATRYEAGPDGNWVVFAPDYANMVLRVKPNPHKNGLIPFVIKYATPLFDNFYGLGDFQRSKPLQFASDGLDNFYFAGIKRGLYPPTIINPAGVVKHTLTNEPNAVWQETIAGSIREYQTNPTGLNTYQGAKTVMKGALLNLAGTTDTTVNMANSLDPGFGKTPEALQMNAQRESTRDNQDRFYLEAGIEELEERMMALIPIMGTETIPIDIFATEVKQIAEAGWTDIQDMITVSESQQSARIKIKPGAFKDLRIKFDIEPNSTASADKTTQLNNLKQFLTTLGSMQNAIVELKNINKTVDWNLIANIFGELGDVPQMDKIIRDMTEQEQQAYEASKEAMNQVVPKVGINLKGDLNPQEVGNIGNKEGWEPQQQPQAQEQPQMPPVGPQPEGPTYTKSGHVIADPLIANAVNTLHSKGGL